MRAVIGAPGGDPLCVVVRDARRNVLACCTLDAFIAANADGLDDGEIGALRSRIAKRQDWHCGGGAAPAITVSPA